MFTYGITVDSDPTGSSLTWFTFSVGFYRPDATVVPFTIEDRIEAVIESLGDWLVGNSNNKVKNAAKDAGKALDAYRHQDYCDTIDQLRNAAKQLDQAGLLDDLRDELMAIARQLAKDTIVDALNSGGDAGLIEDAWGLLEDGDLADSLGKLEKALNKYKEAYGKAVESVTGVNPC
jgi:uncharacterized protein YjgD (DUF1641 family)